MEAGGPQPKDGSKHGPPVNFKRSEGAARARRRSFEALHSSSSLDPFCPTYCRPFPSTLSPFSSTHPPSLCLFLSLFSVFKKPLLHSASYYLCTGGTDLISCVCVVCVCACIFVSGSSQMGLSETAYGMCEWHKNYLHTACATHWRWRLQLCVSCSAGWEGFLIFYRVTISSI